MTPNFFIVGAPKCGTTALNTYLGRHPEIYTSPIKESNHFATDLIREDDPWRPTERYLRLFRDAKDARLVGEASVFHLFSKEAARNIRRFDSYAKIIVMVRNPVDMLHSYHSQLLYNGDEDISDFRQALDAEEQRKAGSRLPKYTVRFVERFYYREVATFSAQLQRYFDTFERDRMMIVVYDDFRDQTLATYRSVLGFLGVDESFIPPLEVVNANKQVRSVALQGYLRSRRRLAKKDGGVFPRAIRAAVMNRLEHLNVCETPRPRLDPALRRRLQEEFQPEVERLSSLLGRDLRSWSRP